MHHELLLPSPIMLRPGAFTSLTSGYAMQQTCPSSVWHNMTSFLFQSYNHHKYSNLYLLWFCDFAIGIPHHNIMDKREELRIPEDLTVREGRYITEDTSSGCARCFFTFACCRERSGCAFQAGRLHQVRLSVSETLSLSLSLPLYRSFALSPSFPLVYYTYSQLDCIVSCHLASQTHS